MSQLCKSVQYACRSKKLAQAKRAPKAFNSERTCEKLAIVVHVLQNTQNLVNSRCCFVEDGKEMYLDSKRTCTAIVSLIKLIVW